MGPILVAIILFVVDSVVVLPDPVHTLILIAAVVALIYGLYILFIGYRGPVNHGRRYWY